MRKCNLIILSIFFIFLLISTFLVNGAVNQNIESKDDSFIIKIFKDFLNLFTNSNNKEVKIKVESNLNKFDMSEVNIQELKEETVNIEEKNFQGSLVILHSDDFVNPENNLFYYFLQDEEKTYRLISEKQIPIISNSKIEIKGKLLENKIYIEDINDESFNIIDSFTSSASIGVIKYAVILANFQENLIEPVTKEEVEMALETINDFYREASYGKLGITGDVYGYYTLNLTELGVPYPFSTPDPYIKDIAIKIADSDIYYPNYDGVIIMYPRPDGTYHTGWATCSKKKWLTDDGNVSLYEVHSLFPPKEDFKIYNCLPNETMMSCKTPEIAHEIGHNIRICGHASLANRGFRIPTPINLGSLLNAKDSYDIMGSSTGGQGKDRELYHFNAELKDRLGWFNDQQIIEVDQSGIYEIYPYESNNNLPKTLKISGYYFDNLGAQYDFYFYIEYRQPLGFDTNFNNDEVTKGALLHLSNNFYADTYLIDIHPPILGDPDLFTIKPDERYICSVLTPNSGVSISTILATSEKLVLNINFLTHLSKIENIGTKPETGELYIKIQKFENNKWIDYKDITPYSINLDVNESFNLVPVFNEYSYITLSDIGFYRINITILTSYFREIITTATKEFYVGMCSEGTLYKNCATTQPLYCDDGKLISNCQLCGCSKGYKCSSSGACSSTIITPPLPLT